MAELVLRAVINKTVDIAGNLIIQEASRLYWLKRDIDWLEGQLNFMESYLEDAQAKEAGDRRVATLMKRIEELALDVDDLLDTYLPQLQSLKGKGRFRWLKKVPCFFGSALSAHNFAMEIEKIKRRVQEIDQARTTFGITETSGSREENSHEGISRRSILYADEPEIIGQDKNSNELENKLLDPSVHYDVISIVGMPGIGKTTLAKRIYNRVKDQFDCSAMEYVSRVPKVKQLLRSIAKQVGVPENQLKDDDLQLEGLQDILRSILKEKKYVILLDDIWTTAAWDDLKKSIFPSIPKSGSRLIITSRNNDIGRYIGEESSLHKLKPLNSEDSLKLFWKSVTTCQRDTNYLSNLEDIGRKIAKKCGGVPLAIVVTAGILRARERNERQWGLVLKGMGHNKEDECSRILTLSYKDLPSKLKPCFLYLSLFPEDYEIPASRLINMWMAEKFIRAHGGKEVEEVGEDYLYDLAARNLVQVVKRGFDGRIKSCRIHDLLHSLCVNMAQENNFFQTLDTLEKLDPNSVKKVRRLTTHLCSMDDYIALNPQMPKLRALLCFTEIRQLEEQHLRIIFEEHRFLRVLRIDVDYISEYVTKRNRKMRQLSYLEVHGPYANSSHFKKLGNLQSIHFGKGVRVDSDHIWKMEQLRHLVGVDGYFSTPTEVSLPNLQTLDIWSLRWQPEMVLIFNKLPSLRRLRMRVRDDVGEPMIEALPGTTPMMPKIEILKFDFYSISSKMRRMNLSRYLNLVCLRLNVNLEKLPNPDEFPPNLIKLTLIGSRLTEDPMKTLGRLPKLKILKLKFHSYEGERIHFSGLDSFPHLKVMLLSGLRNLVEVLVDDGVLPQLDTLVIDYCPALKKIPERLQDTRKMAYPKGNTWG